jgi:hypothetical protein
MNDDLTFGATLLACFIAVVATVWIEASLPPTDVAAAPVRKAPSRQAEAKGLDNVCALVAATQRNSD